MTLKVGEPAGIANGITLRVDRFAPRSVEQTRPALVPDLQRDRTMGEWFSMIRLDLPAGSHGHDDGHGHEGHEHAAHDARPQRDGLWLPYHRFAFDTRDDVLRRFPYRPSLFEFNGKLYEIMFTRQRQPLPAPVALDDFKVDTHIGGFTGDTSSILDWMSLIRFQGADGQWLDPQQVRVNQPTEFRGHWLYQAQWDPPDPARAAGEIESAGLNYTVLGVGNRNGVHVMLAGCIISVMGMIYAWYLRPLIKRRRQQAVYASVRDRGESAELLNADATRGPSPQPAPQPAAAAWRTPSP
jgi:hypothetical protein